MVGTPAAHTRVTPLWARLRPAGEAGVSAGESPKQKEPPVPKGQSVLKGGRGEALTDHQMTAVGMIDAEMQHKRPTATPPSPSGEKASVAGGLKPSSDPDVGRNTEMRSSRLLKRGGHFVTGAKERGPRSITSWRPESDLESHVF
ncbi:hypothetical protein NDU88_008930 [Pleurodeles waltl]|uniref:Uncharacterized protein n=1 Tax=Pleurodeles waltl TaxID=8319 RepID=A0AAV7QQ35_PLEWA|nr:hypothetical protein NDU88_008930 [Pleurodeles waltl]